MRPAIVVPFIPLLLILACGANPTTGPSPAPIPVPTPTPTPPPPAAPQTVTHTLTITASPSCTALADVAKMRTYSAQVQEKSGGDMLVWVVNSTDIMVGWANDDGFTGTRDGNIVRFDITDDVFATYAMIERIPGVGDMGYAGTATGTIDDNRRIVATFNGEYRLGYGKGPVLCKASDHHIEITPI
jgi:hypothetical protein